MNTSPRIPHGKDKLETQMAHFGPFETLRSVRRLLVSGVSTGTFTESSEQYIEKGESGFDQSRDDLR